MELSNTEILQLLRRRKGWTIEALAEKADMSAPTLRRILGGTMSPRIEQLENIAWAVGATVEVRVVAPILEGE